MSTEQSLIFALFFLVWFFTQIINTIRISELRERTRNLSEQCMHMVSREIIDEILSEWTDAMNAAILHLIGEIDQKKASKTSIDELHEHIHAELAALDVKLSDKITEIWNTLYLEERKKEGDDP